MNKKYGLMLIMMFIVLATISLVIAADMPINIPDQPQLTGDQSDALNAAMSPFWTVLWVIDALAFVALVFFSVKCGLQLMAAGNDEGRRNEIWKSYMWQIIGFAIVVFAIPIAKAIQILFAR